MLRKPESWVTTGRFVIELAYRRLESIIRWIKRASMDIAIITSEIVTAIVGVPPSSDV